MFTEFTDPEGLTRWADPAAVPADAILADSQQPQAPQEPDDPVEPPAPPELIDEEVPDDGVDGTPDDL